METGVPVECRPIQAAQAPQRRDNLLQLGRLEPKEDILELGAVKEPLINKGSNYAMRWRGLIA